MKWIVTGAAGFIGSNLCNFLLENTQSVIGIDSLIYGNIKNIDRLIYRFPDSFTFIREDIQSVDWSVFSGQSFQAIVHLAAQVSVQKSLDNPFDTHASNSTAFLSALSGARTLNPRQFIYASSCSIYGDNPNLPLSEDEEPSPISFYASTKLSNEIYSRSATSLGVKCGIVGLRFFNVYGAWQDYQSGYAAVIPKWVNALTKKEQVYIDGDGTASRDFISVIDLSRIIYHLALSEEKDNSIINVCTGMKTSLNDLLNVLIERINAQLSICDCADPIYRPWGEGNVLHSCGDPTKLLSRLPQDFRFLSLKEGIGRMLAEEYSSD